MSSFDVFQLVLLLGVALAGLAVVLTRDPKRQVFVASFFGLLETILFFSFHSPDVALSELVIGTLVLPMVIFLTLARLEGRQR